LEENGKREAEELEAARSKYEKSLLVRSADSIRCTALRCRVIGAAVFNVLLVPYYS
jgi:hypothetical protein